MNEKNICPQCGNPVSPHAPQGVCPSCLAKANLGTGATAWGGGAGYSAAMPVEEVARLFPEMEVLELIGAGGMGAVYKARQPQLDRLVALKILHRDERDAGFVERFSREAKTLARLNHPNIVAVHEFGERDGLFFLIMELVDGATLRQLLGEGKMKPEAALAIVPPICEALQYAHEKGVVHRDIKPENILVDKEGRVKVADFGIARLAGTDVERTENLTGEGQVVGTAHYMAPEQVEHPSEVDHRADIYALGVVFYEMLTGELPLGKFPEPSKRVQVDVRLDEVVLKALEKEPGRRYQTAVEMRTEVETASGTRNMVTEMKTESAGGNEAIGWRVWAPAIGLLAVAVLDLLPGIGLLYYLFSESRGMLLAPGPVLVWGFALFVIVFGAIQMMCFRSYGWAIAGAIVAMLLPPGFLIGIPVGVWALAVLSGREAREAFPGGDRRAAGSGGSSMANRVVWIGVAVVGFFVVGFVLVAVSGTIASIAIPAWERSREGRNKPVQDGALGQSGSSPVREVMLRSLEPPFIANYGGGTVELVALAPHPSTDGPAWLANGAPFEKSLPKREGKSWVAERTMREIAFLVRSETGDASFPVTKYGPGNEVQGQGGTYFAEVKEGTGRLFIQAVACLPGATETGVRVGIADGRWQEAITLPFAANNLRGSSQESRESGMWEAGFQGIAGNGGEVALSIHYTRKDEWETRMVALNKDGSVLALKGVQRNGAKLSRKLAVFRRKGLYQGRCHASICL